MGRLSSVSPKSSAVGTEDVLAWFSASALGLLWLVSISLLERTYGGESIKPSTKVSKLLNASSHNHALHGYSSATPNQDMIKTGVPIATLFPTYQSVRVGASLVLQT
ncbi:hypothetical protein BOTNAR_0060g00150 [Botryotinia narcissicola]|uniref:Uncharacterized protein n=1 Tax=Botryotinia narcissicola TaxID=278944 RepID=A0A4Z1IYM9_9HELO|nr:hypothetical protein BOTNAR_0060g00150 [Botryotinia narcissicola]